MKLYIIVLLIMACPWVSYSDEEGEENSFGKGKAIVEVKDEGKEFKLSAESIKLLEIKYVPVQSKLNEKTLTISQSSLVTYQDKMGIYLFSNGWFKLSEIKIIKRENNKLLVKVMRISTKDNLVVSSVGLLRVAHLQALGALGNVDLD